MNGKGALFFSRNKKTDRHPDYTGDFEIDGKKFWLSAWKKQTKKGDVYLSLALGQPKEDRGEYQQPVAQQPAAQELLDDDIPFN